MEGYAHRDEMRTFIEHISDYAKKGDSSFLIIPQNGIELIVQGEDASNDMATSYLNAIDAHGQEDLFYGYDDDNEATPEDTTNYLKDFLDLSKKADKTILVTDYVSAPEKMDRSYQSNTNAGYISFAADHRELNNIPKYPAPIYAENVNNIEYIHQAKNFLYLINPEAFSAKEEFLGAIGATNYDLLILDLFFNDGRVFSKEQINQLKRKANGGRRLVIAYMSIGEAENYRYYWKEEWASNPPSWLDEENPNWKGNYKVRYWDSNWQHIIYGNTDSYLQKIISAGFNGVYLDLVDAFEYYE
ncbi:MAG TPA: hypothetical protein ENH91_14785 [Leeuwenhoekiella sp.]|nr:hypothetical protein [Leeuwenhoekiella sp.]